MTYYQGTARRGNYRVKLTMNYEFTTRASDRDDAAERAAWYVSLTFPNVDSIVVADVEPVTEKQ